jgi:hypothetical protein
MTIDDFWDIVERVDKAANQGNLAKQELLRQELRRLSLEEVGMFYEHFHDHMIKAYNRELWAAAYIINSGCGDDAFSDFRAWLISMGRKNFETILASPALLIEFDQEPDYFFNEGYQYIPWEVYKEMTGEMPSGGKLYPQSPSGQEWNEDTVSKLYPALADKFDKWWDNYFSTL